jgi:hypothetical protein
MKEPNHLRQLSVGGMEINDAIVIPHFELKTNPSMRDHAQVKQTTIALNRIDDWEECQKEFWLRSTKMNSQFELPYPQKK